MSANEGSHNDAVFPAPLLPALP